MEIANHHINIIESLLPQTDEYRHKHISFYEFSLVGYSDEDCIKISKMIEDNINKIYIDCDEPIYNNLSKTYGKSNFKVFLKS